LNELQIKVMSHVSQQRQVTNLEYQNLYGVSRSTAKKELQSLVARGLLKQQGGGRYTRYVLADNGHSQ
jgi:ATP-dependent DNA helicase RecG